MNQIIHYYKIPSVIYFGGLIGYNSYKTYKSALNYLNKYNIGDLTKIEQNEIKSSWDAVKYGANEDFYDRLLNSIIFPIQIISNIIPFIVWALHKKKD